MQYRSSWMTEELDTFRDQFRKFLAKDLAPHAEKWREQKMVDRSAWRALGEMGALLPSVPEAYGGLGATFAYDAAVLEDIESVVPEVTTGVSVHSAIVAHYILNYGSEEQKQRWLPKMATRRNGRRHRDDRARHRLRPAGRQDHGEEAGQFLRHQRPEDLYHQRPGRRSRHRGGAHRWAGRQGPVADRGRNRGRRGLSARAQPRQDRAACLRYVRAVFRQRDGAAGKPARQRGGQRLCAVDAAIAAGAPLARGRRGRLDGARGQA